MGVLVHEVHLDLQRLRVFSGLNPFLVEDEVSLFIHLFFSVSTTVMTEDLKSLLSEKAKCEETLRRLQIKIRSRRRKEQNKCNHNYIIEDYGPRDNGELWYICTKCKKAR